MFYVGMTRAKKYLHLFSVKQMNQKDAGISRFVAEAGRGVSVLHVVKFCLVKPLIKAVGYGFVFGVV